MAKHDVDGVYASDPHVDPDAAKLDFVTYVEALGRRLKVMDSTAISLCMENNLPIIVFDLFRPGSIENIIMGERLGSLVAAEPVR
jgi:uridylate kinase